MRVQREREDAIDVRCGCISHSGDGHGGAARVHAIRRKPAATSGDGGILGAGDGVRQEPHLAGGLLLRHHLVTPIKTKPNLPTAMSFQVI